MSTTLFPNDTLFSQRLFKAEGLYAGKLDGLWGPLTEQAANAFEQQSAKIAEEHGRFDVRTETNITGLGLQAQKQARQFMNRVLPTVSTVKIISGTRSYAEQNRLFRQGRYNNPGPVITNARGGISAHNFGIAWDIGIFTNAKGYIPDGPLYNEAAQAGLSNSIEWGGNWKHFVDRAHFQLKLSIPIKLIRNHFEAGKPYL